MLIGYTPVAPLGLCWLIRFIGVGFRHALGEGTSPLRTCFWATMRAAPTGIERMDDTPIAALGLCWLIRFIGVGFRNPLGEGDLAPTQSFLVYDEGCPYRD